MLNIVLILLLAFQVAHAITEDEVPHFIPSSQTEIQLDRVIQVQDRTINPELYTVGCGDVFLVNIILEMPQLFQLPLLPAGNLLIPGVGTLHLAGLTLAEALESIRSSCRNKYTHAEVLVSLQQIRTFRVYLHPAGNSPIPLVVNPTNRVLDAYLAFLEMARSALPQDSNIVAAASADNSSVSSEPGRDVSETQFAEWELFRSFSGEGEIRHSARKLLLWRSGSSKQIDLLKYYQSHNLASNPYLLEGDILEIPLLRDKIHLNGGVMLPGVYEFLPSESVGQIIQLAGGFALDSDTSRFILGRFSDAGFESSEIFESTPENLAIELAPGDMIQIQQIGNYHRRLMVEIEGEIRYPGFYPLAPSGTTIGQLVEMAGGVTSFASGHRLLISTNHMDAEQARLLDIPYEQLTELEQSYLRARGWDPGRSLLLNTPDAVKEAMNYPLHEGDKVTVPPIIQYVEVIGAVKNPGRYPFTSGHMPDDYILLAGGTRKEATRRVYLVNMDTGKRLHREDVTEVYPGDIIFVEEKIERRRWDLFREIVTVLSAVVTSIALVVNLTR